MRSGRDVSIYITSSLDLTAASPTRQRLTCFPVPIAVQSMGIAGLIPLEEIADTLRSHMPGESFRHPMAGIEWQTISGAAQIVNVVETLLRMHSSMHIA